MAMPKPTSFQVKQNPVIKLPQRYCQNFKQSISVFEEIFLTIYPVYLSTGKPIGMLSTMYVVCEQFSLSVLFRLFLLDQSENVEPRLMRF